MACLKIQILEAAILFLLGATNGATAQQPKSQTGTPTQALQTQPPAQSGIQIEIITEPNRPSKPIVVNPPVSTEPTLQTGPEHVAPESLAPASPSSSGETSSQAIHPQPRPPSEVLVHTLIGLKQQQQKIGHMLDQSLSDGDNLIKEIAKDVVISKIEDANPQFRIAHAEWEFAKAIDALRNHNYEELSLHAGEALAKTNEMMDMIATAGIDVPAYMAEGTIILNLDIRLVGDIMKIQEVIGRKQRELQSVLTAEGQTGGDILQAGMYHSDDGGKTWKLNDPTPEQSEWNPQDGFTIDAQLVEDPPTGGDFSINTELVSDLPSSNLPADYQSSAGNAGGSQIQSQPNAPSRGQRFWQAVGDALNATNQTYQQLKAQQNRQSAQPSVSQSLQQALTQAAHQRSGQGTSTNGNRQNSAPPQGQKQPPEQAKPDPTACHNSYADCLATVKYNNSHLPPGVPPMSPDKCKHLLATKNCRF